MLLVKTKLANSSIHGLGVFAAENIPAGTLIARFNPDFDRIFESLDFPDRAQEIIRWYAYLENGRYHLNADDMRFFNHSSTPNTWSKDDQDWAARDITEGEELTCDYYTFDEDAEFKLG